MEEWDKFFALTHHLSLATRAQETNFKMFSSWYLCSTLLHQIYPSVSGVCWCCHVAKSTLLHIWWECPPIHNVWELLLWFYTTVAGVTIPNSPQIPLLSMLPDTFKPIKKSILWHCLTAARRMIPCHWRMTRILSLVEWVIEMDHIKRMESLLARKLDTYELCHHIWLPWKMFCESSGVPICA